MSISDGLIEVAELRVANVSGLAGIGSHRLQFSLEIQLRATRGRNVQLGDLTASVYAGTSQSALKPLAIPVPETNWWTQTTDEPRSLRRPRRRTARGVGTDARRRPAVLAVRSADVGSQSGVWHPRRLAERLSRRQ